jgi:hypothetical protein
VTVIKSSSTKRQSLNPTIKVTDGRRSPNRFYQVPSKSDESIKDVASYESDSSNPELNVLFTDYSSNFKIRLVLMKILIYAKFP